jgi:hypothetical protein
MDIIIIWFTTFWGCSRIILIVPKFIITAYLVRILINHEKSLDLVTGIFLLWLKFLLNVFTWFTSQCKLSPSDVSYHPRGIGGDVFWLKIVRRKASWKLTSFLSSLFRCRPWFVNSFLLLTDPRKLV